MSPKMEKRSKIVTHHSQVNTLPVNPYIPDHPKNRQTHQNNSSVNS